VSEERSCRICKLSLRTEWAWENLCVHKSCVEKAIVAAEQARKTFNLKGKPDEPVADHA